jgi:hypothetical protein
MPLTPYKGHALRQGDGHAHGQDGPPTQEARQGKQAIVRPR